MKTNCFKNKLFFAALLSIVVSMPAHATSGSEASSKTSEMLSVGVGSILIGSASLVAASGKMVVEGVEKTADGIVFILAGVGTGVSEAGKFSVNIGGDISGAASVTVGQSVEVLTETAGSAIIASGKVIAFIPNEIGKSLMHHSRVDSSNSN